ncbi:hypothetical protein [Kamptonema formosum]|uniref:hypothetical protein n=1 Tax=Kamptonema formosum TaxID=331992 RepID=UPI00034825C8|nr:hypothetical protein [Oscillatoria sp. PCC 10802]
MGLYFSYSFFRRLPAALLGPAIAQGQNPGSGATAVTGNFKNQLEFSGLKIWRSTDSGEP